MSVESHPTFPAWNLYGLHHNWETSCSLETAFETTVTSAADSVKEERRSLLGHPARTMDFNWRGLTREKLHKLLVHLRNISSGYWVAPLYPDQILLAQNYTSGTTIYAPTTDRRFFEGGRVLVLADDGTFDWAEISSVLEDRLVLKSALANSYPASRTSIFPCLDVEPLMLADASFITGRVADLSLTVQEIIGPNTLPGQVGVPDGFDTFQDLPILDFEHNWIEALSASFSREGSLDTLGRGRVFHLRGSRPRLILNPSLLLQRADAMQMIRLFEGRKGRALPFWQLDPEDVWEVLSRDSGGLNIEPQGEFEDFEDSFDFLGIRDVNGKVHVREVLSLTDYTTYWRVSVSPAMPSEQIVSVARARLTRFNTDALGEEWVSTEVLRAGFETIELLEEDI